MTKFLGIVFIALVAVTANSNASPFAIGPTAVETGLTNCLTGDVLNCSGGADGHHVVSKELVCPIGGEKFTGFYLSTYSTYGRHLDWEPVSYMRFPIPIPVCPSNGYVMTGDKLDKDEIEGYKKLLESKPYKDIYAQKHATYFLFAKLSELSGEKSVDYWWLYLNATWEADNCKNKVRYKEYALETIAAAKKKLAELKDSEELYWILKTITPEMHRRIGDFKTAQELVDKFGTPALKEKETNEYFMLAKTVLQKAINDKNTDRVEIKDAREDLKSK
ncbi:MAG TPA: hypothetical protein PKA82_02395 [Pyrinomonadaceae bacterium]|nr:hypothetical protein [Pyrinomonadaceae bacterium]